MSASDIGPSDLQILQTRVYYDPDTGDIVHVHRLAVAAGDTLDASRVEDEMAAFEESLERRHGQQLKQITVDEEQLLEAVGPTVNLRVDVAARQLVREEPET